MKEKDIKATDFAPGTVRCRGPRRLGEKDLAQAIKQRDAVLAHGTLDEVVAFFDGLNAAMAPAGHTALHPDPTADGAPRVKSTYARALMKLVNARVGCGHDNGALMMKEPCDGEVHRGECPKCGITFEWKPPLAEEQVEAAEKRRAARLKAALA